MSAACKIADERVCLGSDDFAGACTFCIRQMARDYHKAGWLSFEAFREVLNATQPVDDFDRRDKDADLVRIHTAFATAVKS